MIRFAAPFIFWPLLAVWSVCCLLLAPLFLLGAFALRRDMTCAARAGTWWYGRVFLLMVSPLMPVKKRVLSSVSGPAAHDGKVRILALNHQSFLDIYLLGVQPETNLCQIVRAWPFRTLFFFAPVMRLARYIKAERLGPDAFVERCREEIAQGGTLVCFPEGHRSRDGHLQRFRSGIFQVSVATGEPVFPMVIHNSGSVCPPGSFAFRPGEVRVTMLPPVSPDGFLSHPRPHAAMCKHVREEMGKVLAQSC